MEWRGGNHIVPADFGDDHLPERDMDDSPDVSAEQPTPRELVALVKVLDKLAAAKRDSAEWKDQHENLLAMFRTSEQRALKAEAALAAPTPRVDAYLASAIDYGAGTEDYEWKRDGIKLMRQLERELSVAMRELRIIMDAKRFDRKHFDDDTGFADWVQSRARHAVQVAPYSLAEKE